jgi:hypothetical protein
VFNGEGGDRVVWRAYKGVINYVCDQILNLKTALPHQQKPRRGRGPHTDKHLPPSTLTGQFLNKADI